MQRLSLLNTVFCLAIITCCCELKVLSFTFQRGGASNKNHLLGATSNTEHLHSGGMDLDFDSSELPTTFIKKVNSNIKDLEETSVSTSELDLEAMESTKLKKRKHHHNNNNNKTKTKEQAPVTVHSILNGPTNKMRAYLRSKTGQFLRMGPNGELGGTENMKDEYVVFIVERMSKDAVRLRGEAANKYICITKKRKIRTRTIPNSKCLLRSYLEENHYELFWSYLYSKKTDGEDGWFLALRNNKKIRKPSKTKIGDKETMFFVHRADDKPDT